MPTIFDQFSQPACARTLGWDLIAADAAAGTVETRFEARTEFLNPGGTIQGGFVAAMLDDVMGSSVLVKSEGAYFTATIDLHVQYVAPVHPGAVFGSGRVVSMGRSIAFVAGELRDAEGALLATGTASARLVAVAKLDGGAVRT